LNESGESRRHVFFRQRIDELMQGSTGRNRISHGSSIAECSVVAC
jgi:hypothetical protein